MKKIRILFTIPNFITAGSGREMFNIIERLDKNMFSPFICVQQRGGNLYDEIISKGYEIIEHPFTTNTSSVFKTIIQAREVARFFKPYQVDIWQSFNWSSDFSEALIARRSGAKYFYVKKNMNWGRKAWKFKSLLSDGIILRNTTLQQTYFAPPYLKTKSHFITGAVDTNKFKKEKDSSYRALYHIPDGVKVITCVAQIVKSKNQEVLIRAFAKTNGTYLLLAGAERDIAYATALKNLAQQLGVNERIQFIGPVTNVNALLNNTDIFVLPTSKEGGHEEGCPVSLLEAMAAEVPCIASYVAGNMDLVIHNNTGLAFLPDSEDGLAECIKKLIDNRELARQLSSAAKAKIISEHSLEQEADAFSRVYKKAMKIA